MERTFVDFGLMDEDRAKKFKNALQGKSFMLFDVTCGISPAGRTVFVTTKHNEWTKEEIAVQVAIELLEL